MISICRIPKNLRPKKYLRYCPQHASFNFNDSRLVWKLQNSVIYRQNCQDPKRVNLREVSDNVSKQIKTHTGLLNMSDESRFYKLFKVSRIDFLKGLEKHKDDKAALDQSVLETVFEKGNHLGRRGVSTLQQSIAQLKKNYDERERMNKLIQKIGARAGISAREFRQQGGFRGFKEMML